MKYLSLNDIYILHAFQELVNADLSNNNAIRNRS